MRRTNFVAGALAGADHYFGTNDDASIASAADQFDIISRIASIEIGGVVNGDLASPDVYGLSPTKSVRCASRAKPHR